MCVCGKSLEPSVSWHHGLPIRWAEKPGRYCVYYFVIGVIDGGSLLQYPRSQKRQQQAIPAALSGNLFFENTCACVCSTTEEYDDLSLEMATSSLRNGRLIPWTTGSVGARHEEPRLRKEIKWGNVVQGPNEAARHATNLGSVSCMFWPLPGDGEQPRPNSTVR